MKLTIVLGLLLFSANSYSECLYPIKNNIPMICNKDSNDYSNIDTLDGGSPSSEKIYVDNGEYQYLKSFYDECLENDLEACNFLENFKPKPNFEMLN